jgi:predicted Rossmann fold nucleotide-binding protein DprA/Smf involved in DNA uptake
MKKVILALTFIPVMGFAEVSNFNDLINENAQAQTQLQDQLKNKTHVARQAVHQRKAMVIVETETYNAPTGAKALKFEKELHQNVPSRKKELDRLAQEINSAKEY